MSQVTNMNLYVCLIASVTLCFKLEVCPTILLSKGVQTLKTVSKHFKVNINHRSNTSNGPKSHKTEPIIYRTKQFLSLFISTRLYVLLCLICTFICCAPQIQVYLSGASGQIVGVKQVDVIFGSQKDTTSLLIQQQRMGVETIGGAQEQGYAASLQQLYHRQ